MATIETLETKLRELPPDTLGEVEDFVEFLLEKEVDLAAADRNGQTALHHAVIGGQLATIKLLLDRDAPLDAVNVYGGTVLGQARWSAANGGGDPDVYAAIIEALIAAGAAE